MSKMQRLKREHYLIIETIKKINANKKVRYNMGSHYYPYICCLLQYKGIALGFSFTLDANNGSLISPECNESLSMFTAAGLMVTDPEDDELKLSPALQLRKKEYSVEEPDAVDKTVTLFTMIQNLALFKVVTATLFCYRTLISDGNITDRQLFDNVLETVPAWKADKDIVIADAIPQLNEMGWIRVAHDENMLDAEEIFQKGKWNYWEKK